MPVVGAGFSRPLVPEQHDVRDSEVARMRQGDDRARAAHGPQAIGRSAMKSELRRAVTPHDLDAGPVHAVRVTGAEGFHRRLFCGKSSGKVNRRHLATGAVRNFGFGKDPSHEPLPIPLDGVGDAIDICGIQTESQNVRHATASA